MVLAELLDLVLPAGCGGCGAPGALWCGRCTDAVGPAREVLGPPRTVAAGLYRGPLRQALLGFKERGRRGLAAPLAGLLAEAAQHGGLVAARCWLVPAPSRPGAARGRGGDHMLALAGLLAERLATPRRTVGVSSSLRMRGGGRDSVGLDAAARAANLSGRIFTRTEQLPPPGSEAVLVDDVVTTGATLRACTAALEAAGVPVRGAVVLCDASRARGRTRW